MKTNQKVLQLLSNGFDIKLLSNLNENQINVLHKRLVETKKETKEAVQTTQQTGYLTKITPGSSANLNVNGTDISVDPAKGITMMSQTKPVGTGEQKESINHEELDEKFESKSQQKFFWAKCQRSKGKEKEKWCKMADEFSKSTTKKDYKKMPEKIHPEKTVKYKKKKDTNEEFTMGKYFNTIKNKVAGQLSNKVNATPNLSFGENELERGIMKLLEKHLSPKMSKRDFLKLIQESPREIDPEVLPKPGQPGIETDDDEDFDPFINPDPSDDPEARSPLEAPTKPDTKPRPTTEPKPSTDDPDFDPFIDPDPKDDPEARKSDLNWFMNQVKRAGMYKK